MPQSSASYREKLKQRQQQEVNDKGKSGLGRAQLLDYSRSPFPVNVFKPRYISEAPNGNAFDILPFEITQAFFKSLRTPSGRPMNLDIGDLWYKLQVPFHSYVGPNNDTFLCLREAFGLECEVCNQMFEMYKEAKAKNDKDLKEKAGKLRASWRTFYNIYDYDDPSRGFQLFDISYYMFEATTSLSPERANLLDAQVLSDGELVVFSDLEQGSTIVAKFMKKMLGKNEFAEVSEIKFEPRDPYSMADLKKVYPLDAMLIVPTSDQVRNAFYGVGDHEESKQPERPAQPESSDQSVRSRQRVPVEQNLTQQQSQPTMGNEQTKDEGCPAGGTMGVDCNKLPECQPTSPNSCSEETFHECLRKHEELSSQQQEQTRGRQRSRGSAESAPATNPEPQQQEQPTERRRRR